MMKPTILAIETATEACSAALLYADELYYRTEIAPKEHTQLIFPMIQSLINEANISLKDVDAIAVGRGPGSFTGVRIAMGVAQGLGFGLNIPILPVSTLEALAVQAMEELPADPDLLILPTLDARMQEIYIASYVKRGEYLENAHEESLLLPERLHQTLDLSSIKVLVTIGSGWDTYGELISKNLNQVRLHVIPNRYPQALHIVKIAQKQLQKGVKGISPVSALPTYLRDKVAEKPRTTTL